jgi:hypothetical protein
LQNSLFGNGWEGIQLNFYLNVGRLLRAVGFELYLGILYTAWGMGDSPKLLATLEITQYNLKLTVTSSSTLALIVISPGFGSS